jgi:hypothetical protein
MRAYVSLTNGGKPQERKRKMSIKENDKRFEIFDHLYETNSQVRAAFDAEVLHRIEEAKKVVAEFGSLVGQKSVGGIKKAEPSGNGNSHGIRGSKDHEGKIRDVLLIGGKKPVRDILKALQDKGHEINNKTLNTVLYNLANKGVLQKEGERGSTLYSLKK